MKSKWGEFIATARTKALTALSGPIADPTAGEKWLDWLGDRQPKAIADLLAAGVVSVDEVKAALLRNAHVYGALDFIDFLRRGWLTADEARTALQASVAEGDRR